MDKNTDIAAEAAEHQKIVLLEYFKATGQAVAFPTDFIAVHSAIIQSAIEKATAERSAYWQRIAEAHDCESVTDAFVELTKLRAAHASDSTDQIVAKTADWIFDRLPATGGDVEFTRLELETRIQSAIEKAYRLGQSDHAELVEWTSHAAHASEHPDVAKSAAKYAEHDRKLAAHASEQGMEQIVDECFRNVMLAMTEETIEGQRDQVKAAIRFSLSQHPTPASVGKDTESTFSLLRPETPATNVEIPATASEQRADEWLEKILGEPQWSVQLELMKLALSQRPTPAKECCDTKKGFGKCKHDEPTPATASEDTTAFTHDAIPEEFERKPDSSSVGTTQEQYNELARKTPREAKSPLSATPSGGGEKWTKETVSQLLSDAFDSGDKHGRGLQAIADAHNQSLQKISPDNNKPRKTKPKSR